MSYQVLARKWRPQNFKQMVGQEHVLQALIHALDSQRLHHAYLFTGTRGVGKTTIGRILAKCLSCHDRITSEPCGKCGACVSIAEGRYVDLIEIDAASRTKVEDMRELLENVQYAPTQGRFKIYLIDEVHMLSSSSFNALLKTLEEPPEHVKFLFATTDPQKLPVTILSRCLQFNLKNMSPEKIVSHLKFVLSEESVEFEDPALWALARAADGSMRDALSLTDQAIAYGNHVLSEAGVSTMLGTVDQKKVYRILDALIQKNASSMLEEVSSLADFSPDYRSVLASFSSILHRVALEQVVPGSVDNSMGDQEQIRYYAHQLCAEDVQLFYQIALTSRQDLQISPDAKSGFEMALLRMLAFQLSPVDVQQRPNFENTSSEASNQITKVPVNEQSHVVHENTMSIDEQVIPEANDVPRYEEPARFNNDIENLEDIPTGSSGEDSNYYDHSTESSPDDDTLEQSFSVPELNEQPHHGHSNSIESSHIVVEDHEKVQVDAELASSQDIDVSHEKKKLSDSPDTRPEGWNAQVIELGLSGMTLNFMLNSVAQTDENKVNVFVETGHFRLINENHEKRIREALLNYFSACSEVIFHDGLKAEHETPMMWRDRITQERKDHAKAIIQSDPYVLEILNEFQATLIEQSIQPVD